MHCFRQHKIFQFSRTVDRLIDRQANAAHGPGRHLGRPKLASGKEHQGSGVPSRPAHPPLTATVLAERTQFFDDKSMTEE